MRRRGREDVGEGRWMEELCLGVLVCMTRWGRDCMTACKALLLGCSSCLYALLPFSDASRFWKDSEEFLAGFFVFGDKMWSDRCVWGGKVNNFRHEKILLERIVCLCLLCLKCCFGEVKKV